MFVKYSVFITCMYLLRDMPIVVCIYLIQIHTFLLFNVLKREVSNVFLYIWTINYSYSYSYSYQKQTAFLYSHRKCVSIYQFHKSRQIVSKAAIIVASALAVHHFRTILSYVI